MNYENEGKGEGEEAGLVVGLRLSGETSITLCSPRYIMKMIE